MEDEEVWIGDGAALLGPGPELTLAVTLAAPAYFARIACRFALLAATMSSTGGGEGCMSRSMSASTAECGRFVLLSAGGSFSDKSFEDAGDFKSKQLNVEQIAITHSPGDLLSNKQSHDCS